MTGPIIRAEHLSKSYRLGEREAYQTLREALMRTAATPVRWLTGRSTRPEPNRGGTVSAATGASGIDRDTVTALDDVSFEVEAGEVLGIIGRNGAGKSTLLKILARITQPTQGRVELYGRVGSLLEVGTGFHPELTGRDNIFLSGAILGMRRAEIARKFDTIVAFAEVERFIDTPVKRYSSGMYVRLAFAVAAHLEPEILLVDEVLAVGDAAFQKRCLGKMGDVAREGRTVLFVSHNLASVEALCRSCIVVRQGRIEARGAPSAMVAHYMTSELIRDQGVRELKVHPGRTRGSAVLMQRVLVRSATEGLDGGTRIGAQLSVEVTFAASGPIRPILGVTVKTVQGAPIFGVSNRWTRQGFDQPPLHEGTISCNFGRLPLMPATYMIDLYLGDFADITRDLDVILDAIALEVLPADIYGTGMLPRPSDGPVVCDATWSVVETSAASGDGTAAP